MKLKYNQLQIGKYYKGLYSGDEHGYYWILKQEPDGLRTPYLAIHSVDIAKNGTVYNRSGFSISFEFEELEETDRRVVWLKACIRDNTLVPEPKEEEPRLLVPTEDYEVY